MNIGKIKQEIEEGFDKTIFSFGQTPLNTSIPFSFTYSGSHPIESVKGTCSCTNVVLKDNVITGTMKVNNSDSHGVKTAEVHVYFFPEEPDNIIQEGVRTENPKKIRVTLTVTGKVLK